MKRILSLIVLTISCCILLNINNITKTYAKQGCCSHHSGVCYDKCCDGTELSSSCKNDIYLKPHLEFTRVIKGVVSRVVDGDTIVVYDKERDRIAKIRLYGVDCPEKDQPFGEEATIYTSEMLKYEPVIVRVVTTDRYGRFVGLVERVSDKLKFNGKLVEDGFAWVSSYCYASFCDEWKELQFTARQTKIGLWQYPDPVNPEIWRKYK